MYRRGLYAKWKDGMGKNTFGECSTNYKAASSTYYLGYGQWQAMYLEIIDTLPGIEFYECIPSEIDSRYFLDFNKRNLIVLDDLMAQSGGDQRIANLITKGSHHRNLSVIYIVQNIFHQGKETRNISLNTHYIVLFKSPRDKQQILTLARQICRFETPIVSCIRIIVHYVIVNSQLV